MGRTIYISDKERDALHIAVDSLSDNWANAGEEYQNSYAEYLDICHKFIRKSYGITNNPNRSIDDE